jgi:hypothetical protein
MPDIALARHQSSWAHFVNSIFLSWGIAAAATAGVITRPFKWPEAVWAVAGALLLVMLFMWGRVFLGHRPAAAEATPAPAAPASVPRPAPVKVKLVDLPRLPGRHDSIVRDFFAVKERLDPSRHNTGTEKEVPVSSSDYVEEVIQRVAQTMKLEAVLWHSASPRAFINDQLLGVGGKLTVKNGGAAFEFEVLQIHTDSVLVGCQGLNLTLELAQDLEVVN